MLQPRSRRSVIVTAICITLFSVGLSLTVTWLVGGGSLPMEAAAISVLVPLLVAPVPSLFIGFQSLRLHKTNLRLTYLATHDTMTGLSNRGHFFTRMARRGDESGALMLLDIDHFKAVNDRHGHLAGDSVIRAVSRAMSENLPEGALCARFGGEELVAWIPGLSEARALGLAESLRGMIAQAPPDTRWPDIRVTVSIGVGPLAPGQDIDTALQHVDDALYDAKRSGRNRTCKVRARTTPLPAA